MTNLTKSVAGVQVTLKCSSCGRQEGWRPTLRLTRWSVLRMEGGTSGWYIDGGECLCRDCATGKKSLPESWSEYDRRCVEQEQHYEEHLDALIAANPGLAERAMQR